MGKLVGVASTLVSIAAVALALSATASAGGGMPYPADITVAAAHAYGSHYAGFVRVCEVTIGSRDLEGLVEVQLAGGKRDVAAFQFINTAGWFNYWRHGKAAPGAHDMLPNLASKVTKLKRACKSPWRT